MPYPHKKNLLPLPNQVAMVSSSNRYADLYSSDSEDANTINPINTYSLVTQSVTLVITPTKVLKKICNIIRRKKIATIKITQLDTTVSARFLSTALHSVSQAIIHAHTEKISLYNKSYIDLCADSGAYKDMFLDFSTFKTYLRLSNC